MSEETLVWRSKNEIYSLSTIRGTNGHISHRLDKEDVYNSHYWSDWPMLYDNGDVSYDFPEYFPRYVKDRVKKILTNNRKMV